MLSGWVVLLLAQVDGGASGEALRRDCERFAADGGPGALAPLLEEVMAIVDFQRPDYAVMSLQERGLAPAQCPALLKAVTPAQIQALAGPVAVTWDVEGDELDCFRTLRVSSGGVTSVVPLDGTHCAELIPSPRVVLEDFDFDGKPDLRIVVKPFMGHSRRYDVVLLQRAGHRFEFSRALTQLDTLEVDVKRRELISRELDADHVGHPVRWKWKGGALVRHGP